MINNYSILNGTKYFSSNRLQNYLVYMLSTNLHFEYIRDNNIKLWISTEMSEETIKNPHTSDITFSPELIDNLSRISRVKFKGIFLKQDSVSFLHKKVVNSYISYT